MSGKELKELIFGAGYTIRQMGDLMGVSEQHLNQFLSVQSVKVALLKRVAVASNKSVYYWLSMEEKTKNAKEDATFKDKYLACLEHCNALQNEIILLKDEKKGRSITKSHSKS
ncbi:MAG: hypothetical protein JST36_07630 [Bacteroidetes bacterium]|nr:hypothetical protein [Bacteroidota bacterium]